MTSFAQKVYRIVAAIPLGEVRTYRWVAKKAGNPTASRAVGQIMKRNPYPIFIPCHRVVGSNNRLGGYVFGVKKKKMLLELERQIKQCLGRRK